MIDLLEPNFSFLVFHFSFTLNLLLLEPLIRLHLQFTFLMGSVVNAQKRASDVAFFNAINSPSSSVRFPFSSGAGIK